MSESRSEGEIATGPDAVSPDSPVNAANAPYPVSCRNSRRVLISCPPPRPSGLRRPPSARGEHRRHALRVLDALAGHPGIGRGDEAVASLAPDQLTAATASRGRMESHVRRPQARFRRLEQRHGARSVSTRCGHARAQEERQRVAPVRPLANDRARVSLGAPEEAGALTRISGPGCRGAPPPAPRVEPPAEA